jgi:Chlorophyll A-B binding protein
VYRNSETDIEKRCYPGGVFDPLKLASSDPRQTLRLKESELRHCRLAMIAFLGYSVQVCLAEAGPGDAVSADYASRHLWLVSTFRCLVQPHVQPCQVSLPVPLANLGLLGSSVCMLQPAWLLTLVAVWRAGACLRRRRPWITCALHQELRVK